MAIIQNKPNMNYGVWGSNGNIAVPTSEKVDLGWIIERPPNEVMNWLQNRQDSMLQFINQRGIPTWDSLTEYPLNAYVIRNGTLYRAVSQNIDKDPTLNSSIWNVAFATYTDYSNLYNEVQKIKDQNGYLSDYVQKSAPVMTADAKGVGYKNSTGVSGLTFSGNKPQLVNNNVVVAEFSGGNNPKDVVTFEVLNELLKIKVGDLYTTTINENPSARLGYGTWERFAEGRTLVGFSSSVSNSVPEWVKTNGTQYGSYTHTLTTSEIPPHTHPVSVHDAVTSGESATVSAGGGGAALFTNETDIKSSGGGQPHNNVQPSIVVFIWRRTS